MSLFVKYFMRWRKFLKIVLFFYLMCFTILLVWWKSDRSVLLFRNGMTNGVNINEINVDSLKVKDVVIEQTVKTQLRVFNSATNFSWSEKEELFHSKYFGAATTYCKGNFVGINSVLAILHNVTVTPSLGHGKEGGENISSVINQPENSEYFNLDKGYFGIECTDDISYKFSPKSHLNQWKGALKTFADIPYEKNVINDWTIAIMRYEYANLYHTMTDFYAAFLVAKSYDMDPDKVNIFWIDGHPIGALDDTWRQLFGHVTRAGQLKTPVRYTNMIWGIMGYDSPMNKHDLPRIPYTEEFRKFFLNRYGISSDTHLDCKQLRVLFIWRRDYLAHPRNPSGKVTRKIKNEDELINSIKELLPQHTVEGIQIDKLLMKEQLEIISKTDILIGMHGAGLTHTLFLPKHAGLVEIYPTYWPSANKHFRTMAKWRNLHYSTWSNTDHARELPNHYTLVDVNKVINMVHETHHKLCGEMADGS